MNSVKKIFNTLPQLLEQVNTWKSELQKIVFTNGCFDILHLGHVDYLEKTAQFGTKLIVALNTDTSVKRLKGETRPINSEYARMRVIAALGFVDAVILFDEPTPLALIQAIKPDILAKGADYSIDKVVGADFVMSYGGKVELIPFVEGYSTTQTIQKIYQL
jgi:rfaE bifunctional protein nucleotidyltransferase chain/domain